MTPENQFFEMRNGQLICKKCNLPINAQPMFDFGVIPDQPAGMIYECPKCGERQTLIYGLPRW